MGGKPCGVMRKPNYTLWQELLRMRVMRGKYYASHPYVDPFSAEERRELMLDLDHCLRVMLFAYYWEADPKLTWEEFLALTQEREDIATAADLVLFMFPANCRPDLDVFDHMLRWGSLGNYDYADRNDLFPADRPAPPPIAPERSLEYTVDAVLRGLELDLYVRKKRYYRRSWQEFLEALETQPLLSQALLQRTREVFSANMERLKKLWGTGWIHTPPLRRP